MCIHVYFLEKISLTPHLLGATCLLLGIEFWTLHVFRDCTFITWYLLIFILHKLVIMMILLAHFSIHLADKLLDLALTLNWSCLKCGQNEGKYSQWICMYPLVHNYYQVNQSTCLSILVPSLTTHLLRYFKSTCLWFFSKFGWSTCL